MFQGIGSAVHLANFYENYSVSSSGNPFEMMNLRFFLLVSWLIPLEFPHVFPHMFFVIPLGIIINTFRSAAAILFEESLGNSFENCLKKEFTKCFYECLLQYL